MIRSYHNNNVQEVVVRFIKFHVTQADGKENAKVKIILHRDPLSFYKS